MLHGLRPAVIGLLVWAALAEPQRPSESEAAAALDQARKVSLYYARSLPDFLCTEVIQRFSHPTRLSAWTLSDTLTLKLSYSDRKEEHKLVLIDGKPTDRSYDSLEGAVGVGEFGATLDSIFDPASEAHFRWERWKDVRQRQAAVYSYVVDLSHSRYTLTFGPRGNRRSAPVGYHGVVEIDRETGAVLHLSYDADHIPAGFGMNNADTTVDYDFADVGGTDYLLPARSETFLRTPQLWVRNDAEFREYRKFSSDSTVTFGLGK